MHSSPMGLQFAWDAWEPSVSLQKLSHASSSRNPNGRAVLEAEPPGLKANTLPALWGMLQIGLERRLEFGKVEPYVIRIEEGGMNV